MWHLSPSRRPLALPRLSVAAFPAVTSAASASPPAIQLLSPASSTRGSFSSVSASLASSSSFSSLVSMDGMASPPAGSPLEEDSSILLLAGSLPATLRPVSEEDSSASWKGQSETPPVSALSASSQPHMRKKSPPALDVSLAEGAELAQAPATLERSQTTPAEIPRSLLHRLVGSEVPASSHPSHSSHSHHSHPLDVCTPPHMPTHLTTSSSSNLSSHSHLHHQHHHTNQHPQHQHQHQHHHQQHTHGGGGGLTPPSGSSSMLSPDSGIGAALPSNPDSKRASFSHVNVDSPSSTMLLRGGGGSSFTPSSSHLSGTSSFHSHSSHPYSSRRASIVSSASSSSAWSPSGTVSSSYDQPTTPEPETQPEDAEKEPHTDLANQLRNPVHGLLALVDLLDNSPAFAGMAEEREMIRTVKVCVQHINQIIIRDAEEMAHKRTEKLLQEQQMQAILAATSAAVGVGSGALAASSSSSTSSSSAAGGGSGSGSGPNSQGNSRRGSSNAGTSSIAGSALNSPMRSSTREQPGSGLLLSSGRLEKSSTPTATAQQQLQQQQQQTQPAVMGPPTPSERQQQQQQQLQQTPLNRDVSSTSMMSAGSSIGTPLSAGFSTPANSSSFGSLPPTPQHAALGAAAVAGSGHGGGGGVTSTVPTPTSRGHPPHSDPIPSVRISRTPSLPGASGMMTRHLPAGNATGATGALRFDLSSLHVLIVDDMSLNRKVLRKMLEGIPCVDVAADGIQAVEMVRRKLETGLKVTLPPLNIEAIVREHALSEGQSSHTVHAEPNYEAALAGVHGGGTGATLTNATASSTSSTSNQSSSSSSISSSSASSSLAGSGASAAPSSSNSSSSSGLAPVSTADLLLSSADPNSLCMQPSQSPPCYGTSTPTGGGGGPPAALAQYPLLLSSPEAAQVPQPPPPLTPSAAGADAFTGSNTNSSSSILSSSGGISLMNISSSSSSTSDLTMAPTPHLGSTTLAQRSFTMQSSASSPYPSLLSTTFVASASTPSQQQQQQQQQMLPRTPGAQNAAMAALLGAALPIGGSTSSNSSSTSQQQQQQQSSSNSNGVSILSNQNVTGAGAASASQQHQHSRSHSILSERLAAAASATASTPAPTLFELPAAQPRYVDQGRHHSFPSMPTIHPPSQTSATHHHSNANANASSHHPQLHPPSSLSGNASQQLVSTGLLNLVTLSRGRSASHAGLSSGWGYAVSSGTGTGSGSGAGAAEPGLMSPQSPATPLIMPRTPSLDSATSSYYQLLPVGYGGASSGGGGGGGGGGAPSPGMYPMLSSMLNSPSMMRENASSAAAQQVQAQVHFAQKEALRNSRHATLPLPTRAPLTPQLNSSSGFISPAGSSTSSSSSSGAGAGLHMVPSSLKAQYDVIITDLQMPRCSGLQEASLVRELEAQLSLPSVPIIAVTSNTLLSDRLACARRDITWFLSKPFTRKDILSVLELIVHERALQPLSLAPLRRSLLLASSAGSLGGGNSLPPNSAGHSTPSSTGASSEATPTPHHSGIGSGSGMLTSQNSSDSGHSGSGSSSSTRGGGRPFGVSASTPGSEMMSTTAPPFLSMLPAAALQSPTEGPSGVAGGGSSSTVHNPNNSSSTPIGSDSDSSGFLSPVDSRSLMAVARAHHSSTAGVGGGGGESSSTCAALVSEPTASAFSSAVVSSSSTSSSSSSASSSATASPSQGSVNAAAAAATATAAGQNGHRSVIAAWPASLHLR